ncbi:low-affinity Zn(2+) transporter zrt2 [Sporothrix eucalyptigena]|uniref:Low-affinity Zn(2+) transporter zrt2 n=1 Tax=Sporothrix eucalyptigena TaxID=1812306 RepID=A0ABP0B4Q7_9PEZI
MKFHHNHRLLSPDGLSSSDYTYTYLPIMRQYRVVIRDDNAPVPQCSGWGTDLSDKGLRIGSIFIILSGSMLGVFLPMLLHRTAPNSRFAHFAFFVCKYFGSGVILATAFMHLLSPAVEALSDECLSNILPDYDWGHAICLISIMIMFYIELMAARFNFSFGHSHSHGGPPVSPNDLLSSTRDHSHSHSHSHSHGAKNVSDTPSVHSVLPPAAVPAQGMTEYRPSNNNSALSGLAAYSSATATSHSNSRIDDVESASATATNRLSVHSIGSSSGNRKDAATSATSAVDASQQNGAQPVIVAPHNGGLPTHINYPPGNADHLAHGHDHVPGDSHASYGSQIVSLLILEFGVVFHSLFIGLSLAGSDNLHVLLIVIAFHQFFEGLGLGSRLAVADWPSNWKAWTGYLMALGYGVTTPIGIAIGLGVNAGLNSQPDKAQLVNGIFDAVSSGILVYTALVELLAHEFMFNPEMRDAKLRVQMLAFGCVAVGVGLMALLAKWA